VVIRDSLCRLLTKRLASWAGLSPMLDAISGAVMGSESLRARAAAAEAAAAALLAVRCLPY
jgi:hypothetical protein